MELVLGAVGERVAVGVGLEDTGAGNVNELGAGEQLVVGDVLELTVVDELATA